MQVDKLGTDSKPRPLNKISDYESFKPICARIIEHEKKMKLILKQHPDYFMLKLKSKRKRLNKLRS